jgi:hypothetical protein
MSRISTRNSSEDPLNGRVIASWGETGCFLGVMANNKTLVASRSHFIPCQPKYMKMASETASIDERLKQETDALFQRAKQFLVPGELFRFAT